MEQYQNMTLVQLRDIARQLGVRAYKALRKAALIDAIVAAKASQGKDTPAEPVAAEGAQEDAAAMQAAPGEVGAQAAQPAAGETAPAPRRRGRPRKQPAVQQEMESLAAQNAPVLQGMPVHEAVAALVLEPEAAPREAIAVARRAQLQDGVQEDAA